MMKRGRQIIHTVLLIAAFVLVNMLAQRYAFRLDLTDDQRYTLDPATLDLLHDLPQTVTVTAWFTSDLPPNLALVRKEFHDMLVEYAARSGHRLVFEFKDPNVSAAAAAQAQKAGIRPLLAQVRKQDRSESIQVFMGAVVQLGTHKAVIPALQEGPGMEWTISSAIQQTLVKKKPLIGVVQGHEEPSLHDLDELAVALSPLYDVQPTAIYDAYPINDRFASLLIIDPKDSIAPAQLRRLNDYMESGHGVVLAYGAVASDLRTSPVISMRHIGMGPWLAAHGIRIGPGIIVDEHCGRVGLMRSGMSAPVSVNFPYYPLLTHFSGHPVGHGVDLAMFQFASPITFIGDSTRVHFSPVLTTGPKSNVLHAPLNIDPNKTWTDADFPLGPQTVGAALEYNSKNDTLSRFVVFSNGNFCTGFQGGRTMQLPKGNLDLMVNAVDWVTHNTRLLNMRGKEKEYRPIRDPGPSMRTALKWLNLLLPVLLVLLYGAVRLQWRRVQRKRRMRPGHVR